jgi:hypothetical protein
MRASAVMALAVGLYVIHRWAKGEPAITSQAAVGGLFAIGVIALLDQGRTEEIARGLAWLFLLGAAYNAIPDIAAAAGAQTGGTRTETAVIKEA